MTHQTVALASGNALSESVSLSAEADGSSDGLYAVLARRHRAGWCEKSLDDIDGLRDLGRNWNSYGAQGVDLNSMECARLLVCRLSEVTGIGRPRVAASPAGNVALSWEWEQHSRELDLEILGDGTVRYAYLDERRPEQDTEGETDDATQIEQLLTQW